MASLNGRAPGPNLIDVLRVMMSPHQHAMNVRALLSPHQRSMDVLHALLSQNQNSMSAMGSRTISHHRGSSHRYSVEGAARTTGSQRSPYKGIKAMNMGADMDGADMDGADMNGADMDGADMDEGVEPATCTNRPDTGMASI